MRKLIRLEKQDLNYKKSELVFTRGQSHSARSNT